MSTVNVKSWEDGENSEEQRHGPPADFLNVALNVPSTGEISASPATTRRFLSRECQRLLFLHGRCILCNKGSLPEPSPITLCVSKYASPFAAVIPPPSLHWLRTARDQFFFLTGRTTEAPHPVLLVVVDVAFFLLQTQPTSIFRRRTHAESLFFVIERRLGFGIHDPCRTVVTAPLGEQDDGEDLNN